MLVAVLIVSVCVAPVMPVPPEAVVVIVWLVQPLSPVKVNGPKAPLLILVSFNVAGLVFV
jgi:hypothetical protein